ncbi:MAG: AraC family transcriptional regulator [Clostridiales bacterium]|nr:AraC family transcriptional regulator [Clostridiales bacterium]
MYPDLSERIKAMKIIYRQAESCSVLGQIGIQNCYFKYLTYARDGENASRKEHYHTNFEIHYTINGSQRYQIGSESLTVGAGEFLLIPPGTKHTLIDFSPETSKIGITFSAVSGSPFYSLRGIFHICAGEAIGASITVAFNEHKMKSAFSAAIIEGRIFEALVIMLRLCGFRESTPALDDDETEDLRIILAKQFIQDNIELNIKVSDVADYCHLCTKQLSRIFLSNALGQPAAYIQAQRIHRIEQLLEATDLSLKSISEKMHFTNEYHFHAYFKKYAGIPPGAYRKMTRQQGGAP